MENLGHKKNTCEEKIFSRQKWLRKMHLKNVGFTYKSQILKFKRQQKVFYKRCVIVHLNVKIFFMSTTIYF